MASLEPCSWYNRPSLRTCLVHFLILLLITSFSSTTLASSVYDYVIVGGGATGLALAVRLSEDPSKMIAVLEAGGTGFGNPNITDLGLSRNNVGTAEDWQFVTVPQVDAGNRVQAQVQGRVLGGGSAINSGQYVRGNKIEYDALEILGAKGWNWNSMFDAVKKSEKFFVPNKADTQSLNLAPNPSFHGTSGPIALSVQAVNISRLFPDVVIPTLQSLGYQVNPDSNGGRHGGPSWNYLTTLPDTSIRSYAVLGYYLPVANRTNLRVMVNSHVSKILWSEKKTNGQLIATGVEYLALGGADGPVLASTLARHVILSASTLNTPKILEFSGVGDPKILQRLGIDVKIDLPGVGSNLCNQPMSTASYALKNGAINATTTIRSAILDFEPLDKFMAAEDVARSHKLLSSKPEGLSERQFEIMKRMIEKTDVPQVEFAWNIAPGVDNFTALFFDRIVLLKPLARGFVHINSTNPLDPPVIDPKYLSVPYDKFVLAKAVQFTRTMVNTEPLKSLIEGMGPLVPDATVQEEHDYFDFLEKQSQSEHHFVGTTAMTPRSEGGVVDPSLLVYGTSNVRVADVSIVSNLPGIHTVSLAYAIAERAAEIIKASHS